MACVTHGFLRPVHPRYYPDSNGAALNPHRVRNTGGAAHVGYVGKSEGFAAYIATTLSGSPLSLVLLSREGGKPSASAWRYPAPCVFKGDVDAEGRVLLHSVIVHCRCRVEASATADKCDAVMLRVLGERV